MLMPKFRENRSTGSQVEKGPFKEHDSFVIIFLEKLTTVQILKKLPAFHGT
jgi:hypothetical protein